MKTITTTAWWNGQNESIKTCQTRVTLTRIQDIIDSLKKELQIHEIEELNQFLRIDFSRSLDLKTFSLSQEKYIDTMCKDFGISNSKPVWTLPPIESHILLIVNGQVHSCPPTIIRDGMCSITYVSKMNTSSSSSSPFVVEQS